MDDMDRVMGLDERMLKLEERVAALEGAKPASFRETVIRKSESPRRGGKNAEEIAAVFLDSRGIKARGNELRQFLETHPQVRMELFDHMVANERDCSSGSYKELLDVLRKIGDYRR